MKFYGAPQVVWGPSGLPAPGPDDLTINVDTLFLTTQTIVYLITGFIYYDSVPVPNAVVQVFDSTTGLNSYAYTDSTGAFTVVITGDSVGDTVTITVLAVKGT